MATSKSSTYQTTRDDIIKRALRIIGALGQGETPTTAAVTEAAQTLNEIFKEWQADGMNLWKYTAQSISPTAGQQYITIGDPAPGVTTYAHLKITDAWRRTGGGTTLLDVPLIKCTQQEWDSIPNKAITGTPTHYMYLLSRVVAGTPPGEQLRFYLWPVPDVNFVTTNTGVIYIRYMAPFEEFTAAGDNPDVPQFLFNALVWALADQLAYEYGVPIADRAQISKKAQYHKAVALSFDQEEGSLFLRPAPNWGED